MWNFAVTGSVLLIAGALRTAKYLNRTPTLEDYLAFRCVPAGAAPDTDMLAQAAHVFGHCWGCYAMASGAAFVAFAVWRCLAGLPSAARRRG